VCTHLRDFTIGTAGADKGSALLDSVLAMGEFFKQGGMPFNILTAEQIDNIQEHGEMSPRPEQVAERLRCFANAEATVPEEHRRRWVAIGSDIQQWLNRSELVMNILRDRGFVYAVVFEKEAAESAFLELSASQLPGLSYHEQHTVGNFASELGCNPNLKLVLFEMRTSAAEYTEQMLNFRWPSIPSARMLTSMVLEKEGWGSR